MHVQYYRDLFVWQKAIDLCVEVHNATLVFPKQEIFGLSAQVGRMLNGLIDSLERRLASS